MPVHVRAYVRLDRLYRSIWPGEVKVTEDGSARGNEFNDFEIGCIGNQIGIGQPPGFCDLRQPRSDTDERHTVLVLKVWERLVIRDARVTFGDTRCVSAFKR